MKPKLEINKKKNKSKNNKKHLSLIGQPAVVYTKNSSFLEEEGSETYRLNNQSTSTLKTRQDAGVINIKNEIIEKMPIAEEKLVYSLTGKAWFKPPNEDLDNAELKRTIYKKLIVPRSKSKENNSPTNSEYSQSKRSLRRNLPNIQFGEVQFQEQPTEQILGTISVENLTSFHANPNRPRLRDSIVKSPHFMREKIHERPNRVQPQSLRMRSLQTNADEDSQRLISEGNDENLSIRKEPIYISRQNQKKYNNRIL